MKEMIKKNKRHYLILFIISIVVSLLFISSTSPLYNIFYSHYDTHDASSLFVLGEGLKNGKILYKDLFLNNGPIFNYLIACVYMIGNTTGVFVLDILMLFITLVLIDHIAMTYESNRKSLIFTLVMIIPYVAMIATGNTAESLVLIFSLITYLYVNKEKDNAYDGIVLGLLTSFTMMTKFVAGGFVYGLVIYKMMKTIKKNSMGWLIGMVIGIVPFVAFFMIQGVMNTFIDGAFLYDCSLDLSMSELLHKVIKAYPAWILLGSSLFKKHTGFVISSMMMIILSLIGALNWYAYMPMLICIPLTIHMLSSYKQIFIVGILLSEIALYAIPAKNYVSYLMNNDYSVDQQLISDLNNYYEMVDNDTLLALNVPAYYYLETGTVPQYPYFYNQTAFLERNESTHEILHEYITTESTNAIIVSESAGFLSQQVGDYYLVDMYVKNRTTCAVYEYIPE